MPTGIYARPSIEDRFFDKVNKTATCWLWTGAQNPGRSPTPYGHFWIDGKNILAHRAAYEMFIGKIPVDLTIDHLCRVTLCVNPQHLRVVTVKENILAGYSQSALNARKTHCANGHLFDKENTKIHKSHGRSIRTCGICRRRWNLECKARRRAAFPAWKGEGK